MYVDGVLVTTWTSSGTTAGFESIDLSGTSGSVVEIVGVLGDSEWLSIVEVSRVALAVYVERTREIPEYGLSFMRERHDTETTGGGALPLYKCVLSSPFSGLYHRPCPRV